MTGVGDRVTVTGAADEVFYSARRLDAQTVYADEWHTFAPRRGPGTAKRHGIAAMAIPPLYGGRPISITLETRVLEVMEQTFSLEVGASPVRIDTGELIDSPIDESGSSAIEIGDWVQVGGTLDIPSSGTAAGRRVG